MAWWKFGAKKRGSDPQAPTGEGGRSRRHEVLAHFREFERTRVGVEAYIEPATNVTSTTMVLIDFQGEWTRRAVPDPAAGIALARDLGIPVFDINLTGYPQRMRDWNARQRRDRQRRREDQ